MKQVEGKTVLVKAGFIVPWVGVVCMVGYILWRNVPLISLSTERCVGTDCSVGITYMNNTKEDWKDGSFVQESESLHVKKQPLEISFINPPAAQELSLVLEWKGEVPEAVQVQLSDNKDFSSVTAEVVPVITDIQDGWQRLSMNIDLPQDVATRKWFIAVAGSQGHEIRLIEIHTLSDPSLFAKLRSWWQNTHS